MGRPRHCGNAERDNLDKTEYNRDFDVIANMNDRKDDALLTHSPDVKQRSETLKHRSAKCSNTCVGVPGGLISSSFTVADRLIKKSQNISIEQKNQFLLNPQTG